MIKNIDELKELKRRLGLVVSNQSFYLKDHTLDTFSSINNKDLQQALTYAVGEIERLEKKLNLDDRNPVGMREPKKGTFLYGLKQVSKKTRNAENKDFFEALYSHINALYVEQRVYFGDDKELSRIKNISVEEIKGVIYEARKNTTSTEIVAQAIKDLINGEVV